MFDVENFVYSDFYLSFKTSEDANKFERRSATVLRSIVLLLAAYIVLHKTFSIAALDQRLADVTIGQFFLTVLEVLFASTAAGYLIIKAFRYPSLQQRDRIWCERWSGIAFGLATIIMGAVLVTLLDRKGINLGVTRWIAHGILWLLF